MAQICDNHLDGNCTTCQNMVQVTEGTVYEKKWYYQKCWSELGDKNGQSNRS